MLKNLKFYFICHIVQFQFQSLMHYGSNYRSSKAWCDIRSAPLTHTHMDIPKLILIDSICVEADILDFHRNLWFQMKPSLICLSSRPSFSSSFELKLFNWSLFCLSDVSNLEFSCFKSFLSWSSDFFAFLSISLKLNWSFLVTFNWIMISMNVIK